MKLLDNANLFEIASKISENAIDCGLDFRLESYSCKMISTDKKSWKHANGTAITDNQMLLVEELPLSSSLGIPSYVGNRPRHFSERSLSGSDNDVTDENIAQLAGTVSRKTLFNLTQSLNVCFPDYDFSNKKSSSFAMVPSFLSVKEVCDRHFTATVDGYNLFSYILWDLIEEEIKPAECTIYSYIPSNDVDPFTEDEVLWHFNFLFYNRSLKRVLFMCCRAIHSQSDEDDELMDE
uniref:Repressor of RNA polymerase III transcription MAF1 n=1 Tax=Panagrolaimus sp. JU765 TaxID=591449 RepID=A0AC34RBW1_9BILA